MKLRQFRIKLFRWFSVAFLSALLLFFLMSIRLATDDQVEHVYMPGDGNSAVIALGEEPAGPAVDQHHQCGYQGCPVTKPGFFNVHIIPHSHDDPGFRTTFEKLFHGVRVDLHKEIHFVSVERIISNVIDELVLNPDRRFMYSEMAFFKKWWDKQSAEKRDVVRQLVQTGQLEFVNGGWCENDEATTLYSDIIDQMSLGLMFLNETFGECGRPRGASQIDTFGHSKEQAFLYAQMGFDTLFIGRLDEQDRRQRLKSRRLEMIWSGRDHYGPDGEVFLTTLFSTNYPLGGFCFDNLCGYPEKSAPIIDDKQSAGYNVDQRVDDFLRVCQDQVKAYKTNHIYFTMGSDYTYQDAHAWFSNIDKLIKHVNERQANGSTFHALYSTPSCYTKAVHETGHIWPYETHDFLPISAFIHSFWTGFFTSRPALKYMVRYAGNILQNCKQMATALAMKKAPNGGDIAVLKEAVATLQHHDGITGTQRQLVTDDYYKMLHEGVEQCRETQTSFYRHELPVGRETKLASVSYCQLNVSQCEVTEQSSRFVVNVYNGLSKSVDRYVRLPVSGGSYRVIDPLGSVIPSEIFPIPEPVRRIPGRNSSATSELVFLAAQLPPMGSKSFLVERTTGQINEDLFKKTVDCCADHVISNEKVKVVVDGTTGLIRSVIADGRPVQLKQEFLYYAPMVDTENCTNTLNVGSGVYVFRPNGTFPRKIVVGGKVHTSVYKGEFVQEIHQVYNDWLSQVIRLYKGRDHVELDWLVGPIPIDDGLGKEVISIFATDLDSEADFYTQYNGRQSRKHIINDRDSFYLDVAEPVAVNYYPVNSNIHLKDITDGYQMTVLTDRAQGGSSMDSGQLEVMVHRRLLSDDFCLMKNFLDERAYGQGLVVRGTHFLVLSEQSDSAKLVRLLGQEMYSQPLLSFVATDLTFDQWTAKYKTQVGILSRSLPANVNILTLEPLSDGRFLFRLEHIFDVDEDPVLSKPVIVSLQGLFERFKVTSIEEMMLAGNVRKKHVERLRWKTAASPVLEKRDSVLANQPDASVDAIELQPMQIRTFIIALKPGSEEA